MGVTGLSYWLDQKCPRLLHDSQQYSHDKVKEFLYLLFSTFECNKENYNYSQIFQCNNQEKCVDRLIIDTAGRREPSEKEGFAFRAILSQLCKGYFAKAVMRGLLKLTWLSEVTLSQLCEGYFAKAVMRGLLNLTWLSEVTRGLLGVTQHLEGVSHSYSRAAWSHIAMPR